MTSEPGYTLEQLAAAFGLTARTARHYLEHLLPPHHKQGRGKRARYGQDTWNCFAFIHRARAEKLTSHQIAGLLRGFSPAQIERVAGGLEQLTFAATLAPPPTATPAPNEEPPEPIELASSPCMAGDFPDLASSPAAPPPRWRVLHSDDELQITHHGQASAEQREQVRLVVALLKRILRT